jgi:hypothetical protein
MSIEGDRKAIRQMIGDAKRIEARARIAAPGHAGQLEEQAKALRAAAARIAERVREKEGGHLL